MDDRTKAVAAAFLSHHAEPEDIHDDHVRESREAAAQRHAEQFLAMLDAAKADAPTRSRRPAPPPPPPPEDDGDEDQGLD